MTRGRSSSSSPSSHHRHSCNDECMLSSSDEDVVGQKNKRSRRQQQQQHPLRQNPPGPYNAGEARHFSSPSTPALALTTTTSYNRQSDESTAYGLELPSPLQDIPTSYSPSPSPTKSGFHKSWASSFKLPPLVAQTASRASLASPTKTISSFINSVPQAVTGSSGSSSSGPGSPTRQRNNPLSDWFVGSSAPLQLGQSTARRESASPTRSVGTEYSYDSTIPIDMVESYTSGPARRRGSTAASTSSPAAGLTSKLSWLAKSIAATTAAAATSPAAPGTSSSSPADDAPADDLLTLDITRSLLPHGTPDILAPSSFHDLLSASEALLHRYQAAYRAKCTAASDLRAEASAQAEELEGAETRARHLKMQLDGMAERARAQEDAMRELRLELAAERRRSREAQQQQLAQNGKGGGRARRDTASSGASVVSATNSNSDSGFESDAEQPFEQPLYPLPAAADQRSQRSSTTTSSTLVSTPPPGGYSPSRFRTPLPLLVKRGSAYAADAAAIEQIREENRRLHERVRDLEGAVEGCLDVVAGLGA